MTDAKLFIQGRGTPLSLPNRFERTCHAPDPDPQSPFAVDDPDYDAPKSHPLTQFIPDRTRNIIATNDGCFAPFTASINHYRGCEHGCIYCFARPTHEYLALSSGLDFETKILVKHNAPELLRKSLAAPKWKPQNIGCSGVTDCYQPIERKLKLTRRCLEVLLDFRNPVCITTKNHLITRDLDILTQLNAFQCLHICISITTLDPHLTQIMEPRTSSPAYRLDAVRKLTSVGIPVNVLVAPIIPALTDHEIPRILEAIKEVGAHSAGFDTVRLPYGVKDLFANWLDMHFPDRKEKILNRLRSIRGNNLNNRHHPPHTKDLWTDQLRQMFKLHARRLGLNKPFSPLTTAHFRRPLKNGDQLPLFGNPKLETRNSNQIQMFE
ncbi:MAG: PA0069 family radical SAM protein [Phycisphaerales bacterium]|nr:PA0069 family radical SAM protein [Phycisphaerales bacterium]